MAEVRISPDGDSVAIRSENAEDAWNAWAVMNRINGGHWSKTDQVADWDVVTATESASAPTEPAGDELEPEPDPDPDPYYSGE